MVKPDPHHDYYADLGCSPTADAAELKKSYRKLVMKWHPDRNLGNEAEAGKKFQDVQMAHDILTDPEKRSRYDADRWRINLKASNGGDTRSPTTNPYTVHTGFPPPPRRTPQTAQKPGAAPTAKQPFSGANRYAEFTRNYQQTKDERAKAQTYSAWEQMKHNRTQPPPRQDYQPPPPPRRTPRPTSGYAVPGSATSKARAGWDEATPPPKVRPQPQPLDPHNMPNGMPHIPRPEQANVGKSPRRPVFFSEKGEPQPAFQNVQGRGRPVPPPRPQSQYVPQNAAAGPHPQSGFRHVNPQAPPQSFKVNPVDDSNRKSAPYMTHPGEKTYVNSDSINRSTTGTNLHAGWTASSREGSSSRTRARHRSASPHMRSPRPSQDISSSSSESSDDEDEIDRREKLRPKSQYARRASADDRPSHPGVRYTHPVHPGISVEVEDDIPRKGSSSAGNSRHSSAGTQPEGFQQHRMRVSPGRSPGPINTNPIEKSRTWQEKFGAAQNGRHFDRPASADTRAKSPNFFMPNGSSTSGSSTKNSSTENVGTRFSPSAWHDKFNDPSSYLGANQAPGANSTRRGRSPPKARSATSTVFPGKQPPNNEAPPGSAGPQTARPNGPIPAPEPVPPKFSQEQWAHTFKEGSWAFPPKSAPLQNSKPRTKPSRKMSLKDKKTTPKAATVSSPTHEDIKEDNDSGMAGKRTTSSHSTRSNGSAMDLDPKATPPPQQNGAQMQMKDDPIADIIRSAVPPNTARRTSFDDDDLSFEGWKDTEPLGPSNQGLHGMGDLATMLPFESQPSGDLDEAHVPKQRECPPIPVAPDLPKGSLTQSSWEQFCAQFDAYLAQWHMFNQTMINHFQARQNQLSELPSRWTAVPSSDGLKRYCAGVDEDFTCREHWDKGWIRHRDNMTAFAKMRNKAAAADLLE